MSFEPVLQGYSHKKKVIVAPLNWGLGHATRCIPIIDWFLNNGSEVVIATDGIALDLLHREFPALKHYTLPAYNIVYSKHNTGLKISTQAFKILRAKFLEKKATDSIVSEEQPDLIISDNRLGVRSSQVESIVISHQIQIISPIPLFNKILRGFNYKTLNAFDTCWILDYSDNRLAGELSKPYGLNNYQYLGPVSRFEQAKSTGNNILILLSGPEPQRSLLEEIIVKKFTRESGKTTLVRGTNKALLDIDYSGLDVINLATKEELQNLMNSASLVISRTGYTTVMDLDKLDKKAILIPTPGQPEQEYLGKHLINHSLFTILNQQDLSSTLDRHILSN